MTINSRFAVLTTVLLALIVPASPAFPWGDTGHEIVAHIAEAQLTPEAGRRIQAILPPESSLADAATWPDRIGGPITDWNPFHYVNFPKTASTYDRKRDCPEGNCIVEALTWYLGVLADADAPKNVQRIALRFVAHLVGDIHQPLHSGYAEDRGGNDIIVTFRGTTTNLHRLWDVDLFETNGASSAQIAKRLNDGIRPADSVAWRAGSGFVWAEESLRFARSHAYKVPAGGEITEEYVKAARPVIERRLVQAGVRLAWTLNGLFN